MGKKTTFFHNKKISYQIIGSGLPVMLVHGFGEDDSIWKNQVEYLKDACTLIVPQLPGTGDSELLDETTMEGMAAALLHVAEEEGIEKFVLIGHSMGGYTALALAEKYPHRLSGLGLFHSTTYADTAEKIANRRRGIEFVKQHGAAAFLKTTTVNLFSEKTKTSNPELVAYTINTLPLFDNESVIAYYEAMIQRNDRTAVLTNVEAPILFIMGEHDQAVPYADSLAQSTIPAISYIYLLKDSGHLGMLEEPGKSNAALQQYLSGIMDGAMVKNQYST